MARIATYKKREEEKARNKVLFEIMVSIFKRQCADPDFWHI